MRARAEGGKSLTAFLVTASIALAGALGVWLRQKYGKKEPAAAVVQSASTPNRVAEADSLASPEFGDTGSLVETSDTSTSNPSISGGIAPDWGAARLVGAKRVPASESNTETPAHSDGDGSIVAGLAQSGFLDNQATAKTRRKIQEKNQHKNKQKTETESATEQSATEQSATEQSATETSGLFYGWIVVASVFFVLVIASGLGFYNASVILAAATDELDASVGSISGATGMFFAISGLTGFTFSKLMGTVDIRWFFAVGGIVGAAALTGLQWVTSVPGLYVFFAFFGVAFGLTGLVPSTTLVTRWFDRRRSVAISIASTGLSVGGIVVTPISAWLIDRRSLAGASPYLAAFWIIGIIPIAMLVLRSYPSDKGLLPDGAAPDPLTETEIANHTDLADRPAPVIPGMAFAAARTTRFFIALCIAYGVIFFGQVGAIAQMFKMVLERSNNATASTALAVLAGSSVIARLIGGVVVIRVSTKTFTACLAVAQAAALVLLARADTPLTLVLASGFLGVSVGNLLMLQPLLLAEAFGVAHYGRIYSFNQLFGTIGVAGGPLVLGLLRDEFDYEAAFLVAAAASFVGFVFIVLAGRTDAIQGQWQPASGSAGTPTGATV